MTVTPEDTQLRQLGGKPLSNSDHEVQVAPPTEPVTFLIVDDDQVSVMAIKRALKKLRILNPIRVARDGQEALDILRGECGEERILPPYLVTLDINMPRMNGIECLKQVRSDPDLKKLIVFVLTTSANDEDVMNAYNFNVAGYIIKPVTFSKFMEAVGLLENYWLLNEIPDRVTLS